MSAVVSLRMRVVTSDQWDAFNSMRMEMECGILSSNHNRGRPLFPGLDMAVSGVVAGLERGASVQLEMVPPAAAAPPRSWTFQKAGPQQGWRSRRTELRRCPDHVRFVRLPTTYDHVTGVLTASSAHVKLVALPGGQNGNKAAQTLPILQNTLFLQSSVEYTPRVHVLLQGVDHSCDLTHYRFIPVRRIRNPQVAFLKACLNPDLPRTGRSTRNSPENSLESFVFTRKDSNRDASHHVPMKHQTSGPDPLADSRTDVAGNSHSAPAAESSPSSEDQTAALKQVTLKRYFKTLAKTFWACEDSTPSEESCPLGVVKQVSFPNQDVDVSDGVDLPNSESANDFPGEESEVTVNGVGLSGVNEVQRLAHLVVSRVQQIKNGTSSSLMDDTSEGTEWQAGNVADISGSVMDNNSTKSNRDANSTTPINHKSSKDTESALCRKPTGNSCQPAGQRMPNRIAPPVVQKKPVAADSTPAHTVFKSCWRLHNLCALPPTNTPMLESATSQRLQPFDEDATRTCSTDSSIVCGSSTLSEEQSSLAGEVSSHSESSIVLPCLEAKATVLLPSSASPSVEMSRDCAAFEIAAVENHLTFREGTRPHFTVVNVPDDTSRDIDVVNISSDCSSVEIV